MRHKTIPLLCLLLLALYVGYVIHNEKDKIKQDLVPTENLVMDDNLPEQIKARSTASKTCSICNHKFSGNGYYEIRDGIWGKCEPPYQSSICSPKCGKYYNKKINRNSSSNNNMNSKICGLCNGTGYESNRYGKLRVCYLCDGTGVKK